MRRLALLLLIALPALARDAAEYRAFWVDTFNSPFAGRADVARIVDAALASNANAVFVQVRRRGDAWYLDAKEPLPEIEGFGEPDSSGRPTYDPLRELIAEAHEHRVEVHAFVIVGAIWRGDRPPRDPEHVFLKHVWNPATNEPYDDDRQWATATNAATRRFNNDWYLDLGHPDAAAYTVEVLRHLVERYELDGIHLDRIRYPESPGANVGYNAVSLRRFHARYGGSGKPKPNDRQWSQWRRDQVTA
ncbi:MAG TPA: family 10 glycosylhydrolase, partial [Thermoanaerobaculia bacterium]|nr:family 10 glycosylhydrolase [Thermoanaerobaculia bacterium]